MNEVDDIHLAETGGLRECPQCGYFTNIHRVDCAICGHKLTLMNLSEKPVAEPRLSVIETEVMLLIADGKDNYDFAEILRIPEDEVVSHLHRIIDKLKVRTREEVVQYALHSGLLGNKNSSIG